MTTNHTYCVNHIITMITVQKYTIYSNKADLSGLFYFLHNVRDFLFKVNNSLYFNYLYILHLKCKLTFFAYNFQLLDLFIRATFQTMYITNYKSIN